MSFFGDQLMKGGSWSLRSASDPRWNCSGTTDTNAFYGEPEEVTRARRELQARLGPPPADLRFSFMKD